MVKFRWELFKKISLDEKSFKDWYTTELAATVEKNDKINCSCCDEKNSYKMHCIRLTCSGIECNKEELCTVKYKTLRCTRNDHKYYVNRLNKHRDGR